MNIIILLSNSLLNLALTTSIFLQIIYPHA